MPLDVHDSDMSDRRVSCATFLQSTGLTLWAPQRLRPDGETSRQRRLFGALAHVRSVPCFVNCVTFWDAR